MKQGFDRWAGLFFIVIGLGFVVESQSIASSSYGSNVGPSIFPLGLGIVLILLSIRLLYETFRYPTEGRRTVETDYRRFLLLVGAAIVYGLSLEAVGYVVSTFVFLLFAFQVMQKGGWWKSIAIAGAFSGGVYYLFVVILQGSLPGFPI